MNPLRLASHLQVLKGILLRGTGYELQDLKAAGKGASADDFGKDLLGSQKSGLPIGDPCAKVKA